jgi:DNA-binding transcriptional MerR regulator
MDARRGSPLCGGWQAARIAGVTYRQLDYWTRTGLLPKPEQPARGKGSRRGYAFLDLVRVRVVASLKRQGVSVQMIRRVLDALTEKWHVDDPLLQGRLVIVGADLLWDLDDALLDALTGQLVETKIAIVPVGEIVRETELRLKESCAA